MTGVETWGISYFVKVMFNIIYRTQTLKEVHFKEFSGQRLVVHFQLVKPVDDLSVNQVGCQCIISRVMHF